MVFQSSQPFGWFLDGCTPPWQVSQFILPLSPSFLVTEWVLPCRPSNSHPPLSLLIRCWLDFTIGFFELMPPCQSNHFIFQSSQPQSSQRIDSFMNVFHHAKSVFFFESPQPLHFLLNGFHHPTSAIWFSILSASSLDSECISSCQVSHWLLILSAS